MSLFSKPEVQPMDKNHLEEIQRLKEENSDYQKTISGFMGVRDTYEKEIDTLKKEHSVKLDAIKNEYHIQIESLEKKVEMEKKKVKRMVNEALASVGVNTFAPETLINTTGTNDPNNILKSFTSLKGEEQRNYFNAHKEVLSQFKLTMALS